MSKFRDYCNALDLKLDEDAIQGVEDSVKDEQDLNRDSIMINLLTQYYITQQKENGKCLISSLPLPLPVIHECNLQCIYTTNEASAQVNNLSDQAVKALRRVGAIA